MDKSKLLNPDMLVKTDLENSRVIGVYFLYLSNELIYIGKSLNVHYRVKTHNISFERYSFLETREDLLDQTERAYIEKHKPRLNKQYKIERTNIINRNTPKKYNTYKERKANQQSFVLLKNCVVLGTFGSLRKLCDFVEDDSFPSYWTLVRKKTDLIEIGGYKIQKVKHY